jgi:hypothetical protein
VERGFASVSREKPAFVLARFKHKESADDLFAGNGELFL